MILRRLGNKSKIAYKIQKYFPAHEIYIEPFFGAGGMFFNKPKAQHNIMNDLDSDVFNLFDIIVNRKNDFLELLELTPYSSDLFEYWKHAHFTLDVTDGIGAGGFSLETPYGKTFKVNYRLFTEEEADNLEEVRLNE